MKRGDAVIIKGLYNFVADGEGIFLGISKQLGTEGYYVVQVGYAEMAFEPERISLPVVKKQATSK